MRGAADVHDGVGGRGLARWLGLGAGQPELVAAGHDVHPLTLTGLVTAPPVLAEITLSTHVADIVSAIEYADLRDVVLVAHSYSGVPATIAANRIPDRISRVVSWLRCWRWLAGRCSTSSAHRRAGDPAVGRRRGWRLAVPDDG
jgi:pimeloyl-ACP methyl ester carboxylesterase